MKNENIQISTDGSCVNIRIEFPISLSVPQQFIESIADRSKEDRLIFIKSAPEIALVSVKTLRRMIKKGEISYVKVRNRTFF